MAEPKPLHHTRQPMEEERLVDAKGVPAEEDIERTDTRPADDVDIEPGEHVNRPDQPGFDPAEREQYDDPEVTSPLDDKS